MLANVGPAVLPASPLSGGLNETIRQPAMDARCKQFAPLEELFNGRHFGQETVLLCGRRDDNRDRVDGEDQEGAVQDLANWVAAKPRCQRFGELRWLRNSR